MNTLCHNNHLLDNGLAYKIRLIQDSQNTAVKYDGHTKSSRLKIPSSEWRNDFLLYCSTWALHLYSPEFKVTRVSLNSISRLLTNRLFVRFIKCSLVVDFLDFLSAVESLKNSLRKSWNRKLNNLQYSICCQEWMSQHSAWHQGPYAKSVFSENRLYKFAELYRTNLSILQ